MARMRRIQIVMTPELDDWLVREAAKRGLSKSAVVRESLQRDFRPLPPLQEDPIWGIVGIDDGDPIEDLDEVIYGLGDE